MGGYSIPERDIRRRFDRGLKLFDAVYKLEVPEWYEWFSDSTGLDLVGIHGLSSLDRMIELLQEAARRANWDAQHGPQHLRTGRFFISSVLSGHSFVEKGNVEDRSPEVLRGSNRPEPAELLVLRYPHERSRDRRE
jgi:hypothetical protein